LWIGAIRHTAHGSNDLLSHFQQWVDTVSVLRVMSTPSPSLTKVAIVGASGYSGEELCALLDRHPMAEVTAVFSRQYAGQSLGEVMPRFTGHKIASLVFTEADPAKVAACDAGVVFLALPHGVAAEYAAVALKAGKIVIDLSADFRLRDAVVYADYYGGEHPAPELLREAIYAIPELSREAIKDSTLIACAGCYPTSIQLPLIPLLKAGLLAPEGIVASSASGVSGAGKKPAVDYLYAECNENMRAYGLPRHRHLSEVEQQLSLATGGKVAITFIPHLAPMNRGIHTTIVATPAPGKKASDLKQALLTTYAEEPFVRIREHPPETKHVTGTNFCDIALFDEPRTGRVVILSVIDNLVKGAAGQAVQCFNLRAGLPETAGLI
jgi:N-acetyl-gamma-glutamyl-phosphate reductase